ncbi:hypothetical protein B0A55_12409 [Friedmanniomyces simplex]|uniref:ML-like domain-containing protein n=1 Tax=Friedmanniomyces simplex TaxID=329884 RepID=A0A4U0W7B9_9PEZI|nr:hypothetical protein B0A55_12409 [Friedmanniomyces simplex]
MPPLSKLAALLGAASAALVAAAPYPVVRATSSSTFPGAFKVQLSGGYQGYSAIFEQILETGGNPAAATTFFMNQTSYGGDNDVPQLTYGFISLRNNKAFGSTPGIPVVASLESDCTIDFTVWEAHADSILEVCDRIAYPATSLKSACDAVTATLIDGTPP